MTATLVQYANDKCRKTKGETRRTGARSVEGKRLKARARYMSNYVFMHLLLCSLRFQNKLGPGTSRGVRERKDNGLHVMTVAFGLISDHKMINKRHCLPPLAPIAGYHPSYRGCERSVERWLHRWARGIYRARYISSRRHRDHEIIRLPRDTRLRLTSTELR